MIFEIFCIYVIFQTYKQAKHEYRIKLGYAPEDNQNNFQMNENLEGLNNNNENGNMNQGGFNPFQGNGIPVGGN